MTTWLKSYMPLLLLYCNYAQAMNLKVANHMKTTKQRFYAVWMVSNWERNKNKTRVRLDKRHFDYD